MSNAKIGMEAGPMKSKKVIPVRFGEDVGPVIPNRHIRRWVAVAIVILISLLILQSMITNPNYQWSIVFKYFTASSVLSGLLTTIELTVICMALGLFLGMILAIMRMSPIPVLRVAAAIYVWAFRATPLLIQLIIFYNFSALYPKLAFTLPFDLTYSLNMNAVLTPFLVAVLAFSLNEAAYMGEIIRGGVLSVDTGQSEAAKALGMKANTIWYRIVLPQAMRSIIPATGSQVISMLKGTSIISFIAFPELLYSVQEIYSRTFQTIPLLIVAVLWYLLVTSVLMVGQVFVEKHYSRGYDGVRNGTNKRTVDALLNDAGGNGA